ncbi:uncharacterized protein LOC123554843 isoform X2 [Mercenaria mercenaria]|uniref:uncharacterized protein LOC123554843 isoform X2 n=1 Tax=Mercenaria mercenaria TaxID=6596 RepID=UPI00234FAF40|nr:uncharacterized protein LOC123554843 isoform X2 [Mercenaria mercenaria]
MNKGVIRVFYVEKCFLKDFPCYNCRLYMKSIYMDKFQPHMTMDTKLEKLFEEIQTAAGDRLTFPINSNLNSSQVGSIKHPEIQQLSQLTDMEKAEIFLHSNGKKYVEVLRKEYSCKRASGSVTDSKQNDLVLSSGRNQRFQHKSKKNTEYTEFNGFLDSELSTAEIADKQQAGNVLLGKNDQFITSAERKVSKTNNSKKDTVESERTNIASDSVNVVIHDHDTDVCSDVPVHTSFELAQFVAGLEQFSGSYSNFNKFEFDRYKEHLDSSGVGNTLQSCSNIDLGLHRKVNPYTDISSDAFNVSASSVDSSVHIESLFDQVFEESLNQGRQICRMFPQQQRPDNDYSRYILGPNQPVEGSCQIIDLKPSTRRRDLITGKSICAVSTDLDHQKGKCDTSPIHQEMLDSGATEMNVTSESECNKQKQDHRLQPELCRLSTGSNYVKMQEESTTDLQPSFRRKRVSANKSRSKEKCQISTQISLAEKNESSNDTCRNQRDRSSYNQCTYITAERNSNDANTEKEKVQTLHTYGIHSLEEKGIRPIRGSKARNRCKNTTRVLSNKDRVRSTSEEGNIPVTFRNSVSRDSLSDHKNKQCKEQNNILSHNTHQLQHCSKQYVPCSGEQFKQQNKETKPSLELGSCSKRSGQTTSKTHGPGYFSCCRPPDSSLDVSALDFNENTSSASSRNHELHLQSMERNKSGSFENHCDLKKGTKRKRYNSFPNIFEMSKRKEFCVRNKGSFASNCVLSGGQAKKKNRIKAKNKVVKRKAFVQNGQRIIHKIHKKIAESSDLRSEIPGSENKESIESETVKISELENIIPLDVLTCKNPRKARMRLEKQKGALHRHVSKDAIWRFVNSKY